ncbi:hypothetical protein Tco_0624079 [Tanacetum coccineum]|uniref:Uncharacterized protein n=1 Tax=Tanacetum coccineum TaxID=301880 RepID=A0ABQ4WCT8_9ASTR
MHSHNHIAAKEAEEMINPTPNTTPQQTALLKMMMMLLQILFSSQNWDDVIVIPSDDEADAKAVDTQVSFATGVALAREWETHIELNEMGRSIGGIIRICKH